MNNDFDKERLAEHALDALDEIEARGLEAHLVAEPELAADLKKWRETAAALSLAAEPQEPSAELRSRILEKIKTTPQTSGGNSNVKAFADYQKPAPAVSNVVQFAPRQTKNVWSFAPTIGAVAASIIAVFLAVALYNQAQSSSVKTAQLAELNQKISQYEQRLNDTQAQLERERQDREMLGSPESVVASLSGTENVPQARARLVFDKQTGRAMLSVENLPGAPKGKIYQVWFIADPNKPIPGGVFAPNQAGKAVIRDTMTGDSLKASVFAVTLEPEGGSLAPTTKPYLVSRSL